MSKQPKMSNANAAIRRTLNFSNLSQVLEDVDRLVDGGYQQTGQWNLTQTCQHLTDWIRFPVEGFPTQPLLMRTVLAIMRNTIAKSQFKRMLASDTMRPGLPTMPATVYAAKSLEDETEMHRAAELFKIKVRQFIDHQEGVHSSPLYGAMDKSTAEHLQRIHCAHHLSFLVPKA